VTFYTPVKRIDSEDGKSYVEIEVRDDGKLFRFVESAHRIDPDEGYEYWRPVFWSGLFADAASAEREARLSLAWLRISN